VAPDHKLEIRDQSNADENEYGRHQKARQCREARWMLRPVAEGSPTGEKKANEHARERAKEHEPQKPKQVNLDLYDDEQNPKSQKSEGNQTVVCKEALHCGLAVKLRGRTTTPNKRQTTHASRPPPTIVRRSLVQGLMVATKMGNRGRLK
jgi:hypothetical protein